MSVSAEPLVDLKLHNAIDALIAQYTTERQGNLVGWCKGRYSEAFIRVGSTRLLFVKGDVQRLRTLDLASVEVKAKFRRRGVFTAIIKFLETKDYVLFIENVLNEDLSSYLDRQQDYQKRHSDPPCYYRLLPEKAA